MAKMQEFKCPCCGGSIEFDSSVQKMKCPFCDTEFDVGTLSEYAQTVEEEQPEDMSWSDEAGSEWQDGESEGLRTYVCKSCGGEIVGDANTAATACPFCGSPVVMTGQLSGALKPDYVIPFKLETAYLAGYFADKYDVTASECEERANERIRRSTEAAFRDTVRGYASVVPDNTSIRLHNGTTKYALYPVWILQTKWKGDNYIFAMNGQTGKFVGNLPTDKNAFARWFLGTTGVVGVITYIILYLIWAL